MSRVRPDARPYGIRMRVSRSANAPTGDGGRPASRMSKFRRRCLQCAGRTNSEIVYRFITGYRRTRVRDRDRPVPVSSCVDRPESVGDRSGQGRKLSTFSDSRQDAAFFAPYLERTYHARDPTPPDRGRDRAQFDGETPAHEGPGAAAPARQRKRPSSWTPTPVHTRTPGRFGHMADCVEVLLGGPTRQSLSGTGIG